MVFSSACSGRMRVADAGCVRVGWVDLDLDDGVALADPPDDAPAGIDLTGAPLGRVVEHHHPVRVAEIDKPGVDQAPRRGAAGGPDDLHRVSLNGQHGELRRADTLA